MIGNIHCLAVLNHFNEPTDGVAVNSAQHSGYLVSGGILVQFRWYCPENGLGLVCFIQFVEILFVDPENTSFDLIHFH